MKILVDLTSNLSNPNSSHGIYSFRILKGWIKSNIKLDDISLLINKNIEEYIISEFPEYNYQILETYKNKNKIRLLRIFRNICLWKKSINNSNCDIVFIPCTDIYRFFKSKIPRVQTIHDIQGNKVCKGIERWYFKIFTPLLLRNSKYIISISNFVKNDITRTYKFISSNKIRTIHNGVLFENKISSSTLDIDYNYLLYISTLREYKNILTLIKAFIELKDAIPHKLIIVGRETQYWRETIIPLIKKNNIEKRIVHFSNYITNEDIMYLYKHTDIFISPSLHEGFGYTPIEAAICGAPVISSKDTALYETTLGILNYYEPAQNYINLKEKILEILATPPSQELLTHISQQLSSRYNYIQQAQKVYEYIVECHEHNQKH